MTKRIRIPNDILMEEVARIISKGDYATIRVKGNSMRPFLIGNKDKVRLVPATHFEKYDIVLARIGGLYVLHRIINIEKESVLLMGDGNISAKERSSFSDIIAKVDLRIRNNKEERLPSFMPQIWLRLLPVRRFLLFFHRITTKI